MILSVLTDFQISSPEFVAVLPTVIAGLVFVIERYAFLTPKSNPLTFWRLLCQRMGEKVLPENPHSQQAVISGSLALLVLLLPLFAIAYLVYEFAYYQWILDALLLYLALSFGHEKRIGQQVFQAISYGKKQLARNKLSQITLRDTDRLSPLGIQKAATESLFLRFVYQQFVTICIFLIFGGLFALTYRLIYEASQVWSQKILKFRLFGNMTFAITQWLQYLFNVVFVCFYLCLSGKFVDVTKQLFTRQMWQFGGIKILRAVAVGNSINLGGPVLRGGQKYNRARFNYGQDPDSTYLRAIFQRLDTLVLVTLIIGCIVALLFV